LLWTKNILSFLYSFFDGFHGSPSLMVSMVLQLPFQTKNQPCEEFFFFGPRETFFLVKERNYGYDKLL